MEGEAAKFKKLEQVNHGLTLALLGQQDLTSRQERQIKYLQEDLGKAEQHASSLEALAMQQQAQIDQLRQQLQLQLHHPFGVAPNAFFNAGLPSLNLPVATANNQTFSSPVKQSRLPFSDVHSDDNGPLKLPPKRNAVQSKADKNNSNNIPLKLPPKQKDIQKRAPANSPASKPTQKRLANGPTPQKISQSHQLRQEEKKQSTLTLSELQNAEWQVSKEATTMTECRPVLNAIYRTTKGNVAILKASIEWLVEMVPACCDLLQTVDSGASNIVENINSWLEHNVSRYPAAKSGGTLPTEIERPLQVLCSAVLFNKKKPMNAMEVIRSLPTIGGRKRLATTRELNLKLIKANEPFAWLERKRRKDAIWPLVCLFVRQKICWNDKYTKVDTNYSRKIKCKEPQVEKMENGAWIMKGYKTIEQPMRMWYEETTLDDVLKLVKKSSEWHELKAEYPSVSLGRNALRLALCPSVRKPSFRSCVNEKMSALNYLLEDFYTIINNNQTLRKRIDECPCTRHTAARAMRALNLPPPILWHENLRCAPSKFCSMATCEKEEHPHLQVDGDDPPKLRAKHCTQSTCASCGFKEKLGLGDEDCTAFKDCTELMEVTLWQDAPRNGNRTQREPTRYTGADRKTVSEVHSILVDEVAPVALAHLGEAQWWHTQVDRKIKTFGKNELIIQTDFSATPELLAKEVGNCHEAEHCVIDIFVVLDDPRTIQVINAEGQRVNKRINNCTYWAFLGPTDGKGKKNDFRFHQKCLREVVDHHTKKALEERSVVIDTVIDMSDNCSGQYKNQFNMGDVAWFAEQHNGIRLDHNFAPTFEFKGVHDGFGKIIKWLFKEAELRGIRIPNSWLGYKYVLEKYAGPRTDWDALEREASVKLLKRGFFHMTEARVGFVSDVEEQVKHVQETIGGDHVLFCDRVSIPRTVGDKAAKGLTDIFNMRGKRKSLEKNAAGKELWELEVASRVCFCKVCSERDTTEKKCPYHELREVRTIKVSDQRNDEGWCMNQRAKRAVDKYFRAKKMNGYINMGTMRQELTLLKKPFPPNASRSELAHIFLSMQEASSASEEHDELLLSIEEEIENPSADDDFDDAANESDLPVSEDEIPSGADYLDINDINDDSADDRCNIPDSELSLLSGFGSFSDPVLNALLLQRRLSTTGSRSEREERLLEVVKPF